MNNDHFEICLATSCPPGLRTVNCLVNPCTVHLCQRYPSAKCTPNYCGSCSAVYSIGNKIVNCEIIADDDDDHDNCNL